MRYSVNACLRQSSRAHELMYAYRDGSTEKYFVAGSYCHVAWGTAKAVGSWRMLESVAFATCDADCAGRRLA